MAEWLGHVEPDIRLRVYRGEHPKSLSYLTESVNFSEILHPGQKLAVDLIAQKVAIRDAYYGLAGQVVDS